MKLQTRKLALLPQKQITKAFRLTKVFWNKKNDLIIEKRNKINNKTQVAILTENKPDLQIKVLGETTDFLFGRKENDSKIWMIDKILFLIVQAQICPKFKLIWQNCGMSLYCYDGEALYEVNSQRKSNKCIYKSKQNQQSKQEIENVKKMRDDIWIYSKFFDDDLMGWGLFDVQYNSLISSIRSASNSYYQNLMVIDRHRLVLGKYIYEYNSQVLELYDLRTKSKVVNCLDTSQKSYQTILHKALLMNECSILCIGRSSYFRSFLYSIDIRYPKQKLLDIPNFGHIQSSIRNSQTNKIAIAETSNNEQYSFHICDQYM